MSVTSTDIKYYGAANIAESDGSTHGGTIDTSVRYIFEDAAVANQPSGALRAFSDDAADSSQTLTVTGRLSTGVISSEALALAGTGFIVGSTTFDRIMKVVCSAAHNGNVTLEKTDGTDVAILESGVLQVRRPFYNVSADVSGGSSRDFYEKLFVKNTNSSSAFLGATIIESADPGSNITFNLDDSQNSAYSIASRLNTVPSSQTASFDGADKAVANTDLLPGSGQGVWLKLTLAAGTSPSKNTYTLTASGTTT